MLKKFTSDKINGTKNAIFFLSRAPTHYSFTFNSRFLYELNHKVHFSEIVFGHFPFLILTSFYLTLYLFIHGFFDFKTSQFFSK